jgi:hypothetical protein
MLLQSGDLWHCTNPACCSELTIRFSREVEVDHVYCLCGAVMKKPYRPPIFRYLDFLRAGTSAAESFLSHDLTPELPTAPPPAEATPTRTGFSLHHAHQAHEE